MYWVVWVAKGYIFSVDCRWEITGYFRSLPESCTSKDSAIWIPTDTKQWQQPPLITPIKSMSSEPLCVQLYLEHPNLNEPKTWKCKKIIVFWYWFLEHIAKFLFLNTFVLSYNNRWLFWINFLVVEMIDWFLGYVWNLDFGREIKCKEKND